MFPRIKTVPACTYPRKLLPPDRCCARLPQAARSCLERLALAAGNRCQSPLLVHGVSLLPQGTATCGAAAFVRFPPLQAESNPAAQRARGKDPYADARRERRSAAKI